MSFSRLTVFGRIGSIKEKNGKISFSVADNQKKETVWYWCYLSEYQTQTFKKYLAKGNIIRVEGKPKILTSITDQRNFLGVFPQQINPITWKNEEVTITTDDVPF